jgi:hypothetical protein
MAGIYKMALEQSASSRRGFSVFSLKDPLIVHLVLQKIAHTSRARRKLRRDIFRRIAQSAQLQHQLLEVLANRPETQLNVVVELARDPPIAAKAHGACGSADRLS